MIPCSPFVCVVTDEAFCPVTLAAEALKGGAAMIQLRHKSASGRELLSWAVAIRHLCNEYKAVFIVNDRVDIAIGSDADGVHLGQDDISAVEARKLIGNSKILGISASSVAEALKAEKEGADYIGLGHIYPTVSKLKEHDPLGPDTLRAVAAMVHVPVVAIGGIDAVNAPLLVSLGAAGVAVISAVSRAKEPSLATHEILSAMTLRVL